MDTSRDDACLRGVAASAAPQRITSSPCTGATPARVWRELAPVVAACRTTRIWLPGRGFEATGRLTRRLPACPTAVALYHRGRTQLLALDFDAKRVNAIQVIDDTTRVAAWISQCGARPVLDQSTSGGRHILVALSHSVTVEDLWPVLTALAARCPTLDTTPMLNPRTGCITPPGSPCREGGHRLLLQPLSGAVDALREPAHPRFLVDLAAHLAAEQPAAPGHTGLAVGPFHGVQPHRRLPAHLQRHDPLPADVAAFAQAGTMPSDRRCPSRSEARQSVITHALWRGYTLDDLQQMIRPGAPWHNGLGAAYRRYGRSATDALQRDCTKAQNWLATNLPKFQAGAHKNKRTGGTYGGPEHRSWLAHVYRWCAAAYRSHPQRGAIEAVLQALAVSAARAGSIVDGTPVVAVGGRSLSLAAGLISESVVWTVLRRLRDMPGAPILLVERGRGLRADRYALVTPDVTDPTPDGPARPRVTDVHPAWSVIGFPHRRIYEILTTTTLHRAADVAAVAQTSTTTAYDTLAELARVGLITRRHGRVDVSGLTLDDIAERHALRQAWTERLATHRTARTTWRQWLQTRQQHDLRAPSGPTVTPSPERHHYDGESDDLDEYLAVVLATGPPLPAHP